MALLTIFLRLWGACVLHCRMLSRIPGVYPLDASSTPLPPAVTTKLSPDIVKYLLAPKTGALVENRGSKTSVTLPSALPTECTATERLGSSSYGPMSPTWGPKSSHLGTSSQCTCGVFGRPSPPPPPPFRHTLPGAPTLRLSPLSVPPD